MTQRPRGTIPDPAAGATAPAAVWSLETTISELERGLATVRQALLQGESPAALEGAAADLMTAVHRARSIGLALKPDHAPQLAPYRDRLRLALADLQAQREALARASAVLERAADILVPADAATYGAEGQGVPARHSGSITA